MKFLNHKVSLVMNFICTREKRLNGIRNNVPAISKYLGHYPVLVNYNNKDFLPDVSSLFKNSGIQNLHFQNDLDKNWAKVTLDLISMTDSPYILYLTDDMLPSSHLKDKRFDVIVDEFEKYECSHMLMGKVTKYNRAYYYEHYHTKTEHILICDSDNSPFQDLSIDALMERDFFIENLNKVLDSKGERGLIDFEYLYMRDGDRGKSRMSRKISHCVPKANIIHHMHC